MIYFILFFRVHQIFKGYAIQTLSAALIFTQDLKLGHYIKVPPRASFMAQSVATLLAGFVQVGVKQALFASVKDICTQGQKAMLTCPHNRVFFNASAVWCVPFLLLVLRGGREGEKSTDDCGSVCRGLIGPTRQFGNGTIYHGYVWALLFGAVIPVPFWWWQRRFPKTRLKYINIPVFLNGATFIPPATGINYSSWFLVGFIFREYLFPSLPLSSSSSLVDLLRWVQERELTARAEYLIRKRNFRWWSKFNYILSSALDSGTVLSLIVIFLALQLPKGNTLSPNWWGNTAPFTSTFLPILLLLLLLLLLRVAGSWRRH